MHSATLKNIKISRFVFVDGTHILSIFPEQNRIVSLGKRRHSDDIYDIWNKALCRTRRWWHQNDCLFQRLPFALPVVSQSRGHIKSGTGSLFRSQVLALWRMSKKGFSADDCLSEARVIFGKECSVDELLPILLEDKDFYENSGGGITLSGGECLIFPYKRVKKLMEERIFWCT